MIWGKAKKKDTSAFTIRVGASSCTHPMRLSSLGSSSTQTSPQCLRGKGSKTTGSTHLKVGRSYSERKIPSATGQGAYGW
ncbi:Hypothetical protein FKW44_004080 [Caligus rogercresseyi]|uniref:Uncharacterized protein n=1 Tax=Caligus rogercresseyi TaxID=217165 RepID=A0A7T8HLF5_CALRO|nr:Hypothetical protein FKW44_004080 [Caligus rogercresseyi]